jgi:GT2 family glycosyltransferase
VERTDAEGDGTMDVSVVIVSWNVRQLLQECIASIPENSRGASHEIIVVDNASTDHTVEMLRLDYPGVRVIANAGNLGFAHANNQGLEVARGRYVFFLNPDTRLLGDALQKLVTFLDLHPSVGAVGPRLCFPNGETQSVSARLLFTVSAALWCESLRLDTLPALGPIVTRRFLSPYDYGKTQEVEAISGAAMLVRKDLLRTVKGFDESFIHCGEDLDLCLRIAQSGRKIYFLSDADVLHHGGRSSIQAPVRTTVNRALSDQLFIRRAFGKRKAQLYRIVVQFVQVPTMMVVGLAKMCVGSETKDHFIFRSRVAAGLLRWSRVE